MSTALYFLEGRYKYKKISDNYSGIDLTSTARNLGKEVIYQRLKRDLQVK